MIARPLQVCLGKVVLERLLGTPLEHPIDGSIRITLQQIRDITVEFFPSNTTQCVTEEVLNFRIINIILANIRSRMIPLFPSWLTSMS